MSKIDKFIRSLPKEWAPAINPMLNTLLQAWAGADDELMTQLQNTKAQLFVATAEGVYLDRLASNVGVSRPTSLGLLDSDFQKLIPNLSFKQKQIVKSFYDTMDVFWGADFSRAGQSATTFAPYNIAIGDTFSLIVDGGKTQSVTVAPGDIQLPGAATCLEVSRLIGKLTGIIVESLINQITGQLYVHFRTNTPGIRGSLEFVLGFGVFGISQGVKYRVTNSPQRTVIYQISPGEVLIELPAIIPALRRVLRGSHHWHADATLASAIPPANGIWQGSFFVSTTTQPFIPSAVQCKLLEPILAGSLINEIVVDNSGAFPAYSGELIIDFGMATQEEPVQYITVPNSNTILVNPGYTFQQNHAIGATVNLLTPNQTTPYIPRVNGTDLSIYLTSPGNSRVAVQSLLRTLTVAGIVVTFVILLPEYLYLISNPYAEDVVNSFEGSLPVNYYAVP